MRTRDAEGRLHARLLDVVPGRSGTVWAGWLGEQTAEFINAVEHAALDPFRGYANAIRDELPDAATKPGWPACSPRSTSSPGPKRSC